ncbi:MAG: hypothetical protein WCA48_07710 [Pseudomonas gingeri]
MEREVVLPAPLMIMVNVSPLTETNSRPGATVTDLPYLMIARANVIAGLTSAAMLSGDWVPSERTLFPLSEIS